MRRRCLPSVALIGSLMLCVAALSGCSGGSSAPAADAPPAALPSPPAVPTHPPALGGSRSASLASADAVGGSSARGVATAAILPTPTSGPQALHEPLRLQFKKGEERHYSEAMRVAIDMPMLALGQRTPAVSIDMTFRYEVLNVASDGSARVRSTIERISSPEAPGNGTTDLVAGTSVIARVAPNGTYTESQVERAGQIIASGTDADAVANSLFVFPYLNSPLLIGDTFHGRQSVSLGKGMPNTTLDVRYTLAELSKRDGAEVARLDEIADMPQLALGSPTPGVEFRNGKANLKGSVLVGTADGWPVAGDAKTTMSFDVRTADPRVSGTLNARVDYHFQMDSGARSQDL